MGKPKPEEKEMERPEPSGFLLSEFRPGEPAREHPQGSTRSIALVIETIQKMGLELVGETPPVPSNYFEDGGNQDYLSKPIVVQLSGEQRFEDYGEALEVSIAQAYFQSLVHFDEEKNQIHVYVPLTYLANKIMSAVRRIRSDWPLEEKVRYIKYGLRFERTTKESTNLRKPEGAGFVKGQGAIKTAVGKIVSINQKFRIAGVDRRHHIPSFLGFDFWDMAPNSEELDAPLLARPEMTMREYLEKWCKVVFNAGGFVMGYTNTPFGLVRPKTQRKFSQTHVYNIQGDQINMGVQPSFAFLNALLETIRGQHGTAAHSGMKNCVWFIIDTTLSASAVLAGSMTTKVMNEEACIRTLGNDMDPEGNPKFPDYHRFLTWMDELNAERRSVDNVFGFKSLVVASFPLPVVPGMVNHLIKTERFRFREEDLERGKQNVALLKGLLGQTHMIKKKKTGKQEEALKDCQNWNSLVAFKMLRLLQSLTDFDMDNLSDNMHALAGPDRNTLLTEGKKLEEIFLKLYNLDKSFGEHFKPKPYKVKWSRAIKAAVPDGESYWEVEVKLPEPKKPSRIAGGGKGKKQGRK